MNFFLINTIRVLTFLALCVPSFVSAGFFINEIAWMGTKDSASNEWVEFMSTENSPMNLTGWIFRIEGKKDVVLSGNISANGYYLIERTDDNTVPNVPADLISAFGGFSDTGATLILLDKNGKEQDRVDGKDGWKIDGGEVKGNKTTNETAQRSGNTWFTGVATPRVINGNFSSTNYNTPTTNHQVQTTTPSPASPWSVDPEIYTRIVVPSNSLISGAPILFTGEAMNTKKEPVTNVRFRWSFGDGESGEGSTVAHTFRYPGTYVVSLEASSGNYVGTVQIKILVPAAILRTLLHEGTVDAIDVINDGTNDTDLSSWILEADTKRFIFPPRTVLLSNSRITLAKETTGFNSPIIAIRILYPSGILFKQMETNPELQSTNKQLPSSVASTHSSQPVNSLIHEFVQPSVSQKTKSSIPSNYKLKANSYETQQASVENAFLKVDSVLPSQKENDMWPWYTGAAFLGILALISMRFAQSRVIKTPADDFEILEDKDIF